MGKVPPMTRNEYLHVRHRLRITRKIKQAVRQARLKRKGKR